MERRHQRQVRTLPFQLCQRSGCRQRRRRLQWHHPRRGRYEAESQPRETFLPTFLSLTFPPPRLPSSHLLHRRPRCGKRSDPVIAAAGFRQWRHCAAQKNPGDRFWRYFQRRLSKIKGPNSPPGDGRQKGKCEFDDGRNTRYICKV